ncbi:MAG: response regulator [Thiomargarita sp.]|nr:response regulator [Thiomargarita sp.]
MSRVDNGKSNEDIALVDMGYDLLTPISTLKVYIEMLLEYSKTQCQDFIPDINKMLEAADDLSTSITQLCSQNNAHHNEINFETLTTTISHQLRNRINVIMGFGEMLLEDIDKKNHPEAATGLQKIVTSVRRLLILIDDLSYIYKNSKPNKTKVIEDDLSIISNVSEPTTTVNPERSTSLFKAGGCEQLDLGTKSASLLVVDDDESNRILLSRRLKRQGFEVKEAQTGRQALCIIRNQHFDLILLDIRMPEMNGYQVLKTLKKDQKFSHIPVIMISGLDEIDSVVRCIELGAEDYLHKPPKQVILNAKISATLERKRLRDSERALLLNIFPQEIVNRLKYGEKEIADDFDEVTVLFSDLVGFTELSANIPAKILVKKLNTIFSAFDDLTEKYELEKIKTIGDAYMLVGGLPTERPDHVQAVANIALEMLSEIERLNKENGSDFKIRIGMHTGPVVAGVIGKHKFNYDLWGDTVNIASRMEALGLPSCIQVSEITYQLIKDQFVFEKRGSIDVKGKGKMVTYFLKDTL